MPNYVVSVAPGEVPIYGGQNPPVIASPTWLAGAAINDWVEIIGTSDADGQPLNAWCDFAVRQTTGEILLALNGGHSDGWSTKVSSISLLDDAPAWLAPPRKASITFDQARLSSGANIYPYCLDGVTPSSRHTRYSTHWSPFNDRIMMIGSPSLYGSGGESSGVSNGFNLVTNEWDAPGTYATIPSQNSYGTAIDDLGNVWCRTHKWNRVANTFAALPISYANSSAFDTVRRQLFTLCKGDGQGFSMVLGIVAKTISEDLSTVRTITFNASDAYTEFSGQNLDYSAMMYDAPRDRFLFYYGKGVSRGVIYIVSPNSGTVWDMSKLTQGPGTVLPPLVHDAGINNRLRYVEALDGVAMMPSKASNIFFMRLG
jgi:hypothetical protein